MDNFFSGSVHSIGNGASRVLGKVATDQQYQEMTDLANKITDDAFHASQPGFHLMVDQYGHTGMFLAGIRIVQCFLDGTMTAVTHFEEKTTGKPASKELELELKTFLLLVLASKKTSVAAKNFRKIYNKEPPRIPFLVGNYNDV